MIQGMAPYVRWMIKSDLPRAVEISRRSARDPWDHDDFMRVLRSRAVIGQVVDLGASAQRHRVAGYMVYELGKTHITILSLAVDPEHRRQGHGNALIDRIKGKLWIADNGRRRRDRIFDKGTDHMIASIDPITASIVVGVIAIVGAFLWLMAVNALDIHKTGRG